MITIKMIEDAAIKGVHTAKAKILDLEDSVALELLAAGKAIRHVFSKKPASGLTATAPTAPETASNPPVANPNAVKIAALEAQIAAIEAAPLPPVTAGSSTPEVLAAARTAEIDDLTAQIAALEKS